MVWYVAAYIAVASVLWLSFAKSCIEATASDLGPVDNTDRAFAMFGGVVMAMVWPLSLVARMVYRVVKKNGTLLTDKERAERAEQELAHAKRLAREAGLPWPEKEK